MPAVVSVKATPSARIVSTTVARPFSSSFRYGYGYPYSSYYNYPSSIYNYGYGYGAYGYPYSYAQPSFYGTCTAVSGSGIVSNNCLPGTTPVATGGNGCFCFDSNTGWAGCGNTANGVCQLPTQPAAIVVQPPVPSAVAVSSPVVITRPLY